MSWAGQADIGWSNRIGWYKGFHLLTSITPTGVITGFGFASPSGNDHALAETFFVARMRPIPRLSSAGAPAQGEYVADKGVAGDQVHERWQAQYGTEMVSLPHQRSKVRWSKDWRSWLTGLRQIIETIYAKLLNTFRLARSDRMLWMASMLAWPPKPPCIAFVCGSMGSLDALRWPLPTCLSGNAVISVRTKRLSRERHTL